MSNGAKKEYLSAIRKRYKKVDRNQKKVILDEFCAVCKYSRKYAIAILNQRVEPRKTKPGPDPIYNQAFEYHLVELWKAMNKMCSKKMKAAIPYWIRFYKNTSLTESMKRLLLKVSASTMDRILKPYRACKRNGLSGTSLSLLKNKIPILVLNRKATKPGFVEADTVHHCGESLTGQYTHSLTITDIFSTWTANRAVWTGMATAVQEKIEEIEKGLPFPLHGFSSDNGNEFLNQNLYDYFHKRERKPVNFVRGRPYKKNDNPHVEQKNNTHVRELFGYLRYDDNRLVVLMNDIYKHYWNPLLNFFTPTQKLIKKTRIGGKLKKVYDEPQTPYHRLLNCPDVHPEAKKMLKVQYAWLNPFILKKKLDEKLREFYRFFDYVNKKVA